MNIIALTGNAVKDTELKFTPGGTAIAAGTIAVRRDFKDKQSGEYESDFINFTAFGKTAELMADYIKKGSKFGISGRLQIRTYDQDGQRKYFTEVVVNAFDFPEKKVNSINQNNTSRIDEDPFANNSGPIEVDPDSVPF